MKVGGQPHPGRRFTILAGKLGLLIGFFILIALAVACQTQPNQVFIEVDNRRDAVTTEAVTVRDVLAEMNVELGPLDRVDPDLYAQLEPGLVIKVTRVKEDIEVNREVIPFEHQIVTNEALATGETRLAQLGVNGEDEISVRIVFEDGEEVSRTEISRVTVIEPVPEILVVGPEGELPSVPVAGTIAYIANGNAWLMRDSSGSRRALTTAGNLDGRAFDLSPDGRHLVYTTKLTDEIELPLNETWLASTTIIGEKPITLGVQGVLQAVWSPVISQSLIAYTTAERIVGPPGWQANNDLWLLDLSQSRPKPRQLLKPNTQGLYAWWGTGFTWSPDGTKLAYTRADQIGVIDLKPSRPQTETLRPLFDFAPLETFSEWVWVPKISWSPDGKFIAAVIHGPPLAAEPEEESQVFDLWLIDVDNTFSAKVAEQVGMWANPVWGKAGIAYGEAFEPLQSVNSRYSIQLIDKEGSNKRQIFPFKEELGLQPPDMVWSPDGSELLFTYNGNLYTASSHGSPPKQLTTDGQVSQPLWIAEAPVLSQTIPLTTITPITANISITAGNFITTSDIITEGDLITTTKTTPTTPTRQETRVRVTVSPTSSVTASVTATPSPVTRRTPTPDTATATPEATIQPTGTITGPPLSGAEDIEDTTERE
jgi:Tol biopolymer transport system component